MIHGKEILGILSIVFGLAGYGVYIWTIFRARTKPHMFSWIVWGTISGVAFFAQISKHAGPGSWIIGLSTLITFIIAVIAVFRGERNITTGDWAAFLGALAAILLWCVTKEPVWSVILVALIDAVGFYPTVRKAYGKPCEESALMFGLDAGKFFFSVSALKIYSATTLLYPLVGGLLSGGFSLFLLWRRAQGPVIRE